MSDERARSALAPSRIGAPKRAQASGGAVAGGCRRSRGWAGTSESGAEGEVSQPAAAGTIFGPAATGARVAAALWQAPTQLQEVVEPADVSPWPCELWPVWSECASASQGMSTGQGCASDSHVPPRPGAARRSVRARARHCRRSFTMMGVS